MKKVSKSFGSSENSRTFASAFRKRPDEHESQGRKALKSSLRVLHKTEEVVVQEARDFVSLG